LGASGDVDRLGVVEGLEVDIGSERRLGHGDREAGVQIVAPALEGLVRAHPHGNVEVSSASTSGPRGTEAAETQCRAGVDPGGDVDGVGPVPDVAAFARAGGTGRGDDLTG